MNNQPLSRREFIGGTLAADSGQVGQSFRLKSDTQSGQVGHPRSEATLAM
jgi:hypothetical protein